jgi:hypothetical protein
MLGAVEGVVGEAGETGRERRQGEKHIVRARAFPRKCGGDIQRRWPWGKRSSLQPPETAWILSMGRRGAHTGTTSAEHRGQLL